MAISRYDLKETSGGEFEMVEIANGDYVRSDDFDSLLAAYRLAMDRLDDIKEGADALNDAARGAIKDAEDEEPYGLWSK